MKRTLSANEAKVILDLEWRGQKTVTLTGLRQILNASDGYARHLAYRLVKKGWLERLRPGLYQLVPASRGMEGVADTNPLTAGSALIYPYYFSFGTACTYHGLTEQMFAEIYIVCQENRQSETIRGKQYVFVYVPERLFFGFQETKVLGDPVQMATAERALLDAIDRPRYTGGIAEVSHITARAATKISWHSLLELVRRWGSSALIQRLGFYLDLHRTEVPADIRADLLELLRPQSKILLGSRRKWGTTGKLIRPWNVIENIPRKILIPEDEKHWHRVVIKEGKRKRC